MITTNTPQSILSAQSTINTLVVIGLQAAMKEGTQMSAHALLSASGAKQWLTCTPSARLGEHVADRETVFAAEGTFAHSLAEIKLKKLFGIISAKEYDIEMDRLARDQFYNAELEEYVDRHCEFVQERHAAAGDKAVIMFEQRLDYSPWVPEGFGTGDVVLVSIANKYIEIVDLKYGKGVPVSALKNPQLRLYGLGCYNTYEPLYDFEKVITTIMQPRLDNISSESLTIDELLLWADYVKNRAQVAFKGEGAFVAGEHCRFCKVGGACRARANACAADDFKEPPLLTPEEVSEYLHKMPLIQDWLKAFDAYSLEQALAGMHFPGFKVVEGISRRKITDEDMAKSVLAASGYANEQYLSISLKGITDLTKLLGKKGFDNTLGQFIEKPAGKPCLVVENDKRPAYNPAAADFKGVLL